MENVDNPANQNTQEKQNAPKPKKSKKPLFITIWVLSFAIIAVEVTMIVLHLMSGSSDYSSTAFEDLTKEQAVAFLEDAHSRGGSHQPEGFVDKEISDAVVVDNGLLVSDLKIIYSYDTLEDLEEMARKKYSGHTGPFTLNKNLEDFDDFTIKEYDYYAIVTPNQEDGSSRDSLFSFKRKYLDYDMKETSSNSYNTVYQIKTKNPEIVNQLLRIYAFFYKTEWGVRGNIFSYDFNELNDQYVLTVNYVGAGINMDLANDPAKYQAAFANSTTPEIYGINLYKRSFIANKDDGQIKLTHTSDGSTMDVIKSFSITTEEFNNLSNYGSYSN